jgi:hypothetical protein
LVWGVYFGKHNLNQFIKGLTLAMSILPEEIPVAFTTFMALGSWRLMKERRNSQKIRTVEPWKCYHHLYGQNRNADSKMSLNPYTLLAATNYTKRAMGYKEAKSH